MGRRALGVGVAAVVMFASSVLSPCVAVISAQGTKNEWWPEIGFYWSMTKRYRLYALAQMQDEHNFGKSEVSYGLHFDDMAVRHGYVRVGYRYLYAMDDPGHPEHRMLLESGLHGVGATRYVNRLRLEIRNKTGDWSTRIRERARIEHDARAGTVGLLPYASAELFYDSSVGGFSRVRSHAGSEVHFTKNVGLDLAYVRQDDWHDGTAHVNALLTKLLLIF
jgi:Protein of unknown function (DUF2490)